MITFVYPHLLYLLLIIPVAILLFAWSRAAGHRRLARFGKPEILTRLMPDASKYVPWVKFSIIMAALAMVVIILARPVSTVSPGTDDAGEEKTARGIEVMICLDVSRSMLASSTDEPDGIDRLRRAKHLLERLINKMTDDKVGLIVFAGDSYTQLPITSDYISAKMFINSISTEMVPTQGTAIGAAIEMAMSNFTPDDKFQKAIIIITDGENFEDDAIAMAKKAASAGIQVDVIGIGSGEPMPIPVSESRMHEYMRDNNGQIARSALDAETAEKIARAGKGIFVDGASSTAINDLDEQLSTLAKTEYLKRSVTPRSQQFPFFAWIALILLVIEAAMLNRTISWLSRYTFFNRNKKK
ncbi:MAG: VWA domain-containing protein [Muribaculaceae bacterium]|nr:VWA domain-containing protein [Muribaculaceae bacterium]